MIFFFRPGSDASTVPATEDEVKRRREEVRKTPRPQIKESKSTMELGEREPRLRRDVQSHELLGEPKRKAQKQPATAVKARAAPPKSVSPKAAQGDAKVEGTTPDRSQGVTALAVQECLHRRNTAELQEPTTPPLPVAVARESNLPVAVARVSNLTPASLVGRRRHLHLHHLHPRQSLNTPRAQVRVRVMMKKRLPYKKRSWERRRRLMPGTWGSVEVSRVTWI